LAAFSVMVNLTIASALCRVKTGGIVTKSIDKGQRLREAIYRCDLRCKLRLVVAHVVRAAAAVSFVSDKIK